MKKLLSILLAMSVVLSLICTNVSAQPFYINNMENFKVDSNDYIVDIADINAVRADGTRTYISVVKNGTEKKHYFNSKTEVYIDDVLTFQSGNLIECFNYPGLGIRRKGKVLFEYTAPNAANVSKIYIRNWYSDIVYEVIPGMYIFCEYWAPIKLSSQVSGLVYSLYLNGKECEISDLCPGDIITLTKNNDNKYYRIYATRKIVTGTVEAYSADDEVYTIDGVGYKVSATSLAHGYDVEMKGRKMLGVTGNFYLDAFGEIAYFEEIVPEIGEIQVNITESANSYFVNATVSNMPEDSLLYVAAYSENGRMLDVELADADGDTTFSKGLSKVKYFKSFLWTGNCTPHVSSVTTNLN